MKTSAPNILLLMFDQLAPQSLPCYGHPVVRAPHLDSLAGAGVVFDAAYCNAPLCAPSRFSMMAGQLGSRIGAYDNASEFRSEVPTMAHYLRANGYRTTLIGKMHFVGADQLHGFERRLTTDIYPADFGWTPDWGEPAARPFWYHNMDSVVEAGPYERTLEIDFDEEVAHQAARHLFDLARAEDQRPFFATVSFIQPHDPYMTPRAWWDRYRDVEIDLPAVPGLDAQRDDPHSRRLRAVCGMSQHRITGSHVRNARHAYYGMISWLDDQVGKLLAALDATGMRDRTVIVVASDHGDMLGERGLWYKMSFFERSIRVPLIVHAPSIFAPNQIADNVSLVDLLPTLVDIAREGRAFDPVDPLDGESLLPLMSAPAAGGRNPVFAEYLAEGTTEPMFMVKRGTLKYVTCAGDPTQLYDLGRDPDELHNLSGHPDMRDSEAELAALIGAQWDATRLRAEVITSQQRRLFAHEALGHGCAAPWDYQPREDASMSYNRNYGGEMYDTDRRARIPRRDPPPVDQSIHRARGPIR